MYQTDGCRRSRADRDSGGPRRVPQQRVQVFEDGGPLPAAACGGKEEEACNRQVRRFYRRHTRGRPPRPQEAAPQRAEDLRQARRRAGLRGILSDGVPLCEGMEARAGAVPTRRLPRARLGAGHHAGRLWHLHRHRRRREARAEAPRRDVPAFERPLLHRDDVREGRVLLRGARRDIRDGRARAAPRRARQCHRGGADALRQGDGVQALLPAQGPLPLRGQVLQPRFRKREGIGGECRGVPAPQPPRPRALRAEPRCAELDAALRLQEDQRHGEEQAARTCAQGLRRGPRGDDGPSGRALRLREMGACPLGQEGLHAAGRRLLLRRPCLAQPRPPCGRQSAHGRDRGRARKACGIPSEVVEAGRAREESCIARACAGGEAEGVRRVGHTQGHAGSAPLPYGPAGEG